MSLTPLIEVEAVSKTFPNGAQALAGIDLSVHAGEFVSLLGPSGCGKSTLLRMIAGLAAPSAGTIRHRERPNQVGRGEEGRVEGGSGESARDQGLARRGEAELCSAPHVSCVFQEPTLLPWATAWENVYLPLRLRGQSRAASAAAIDETLGLVGLQGFARAYPRELSGGMKMRVASARALVARPAVILLDEPFAALDEITRHRLNDDLLAARAAHGWSALFVTHSVFESVYLSSRIVVMTARPGRIAAEICIELPYPRTEAMRTTPEFNAYCRQASAALREVMGEWGASGEGRPI